MRGVLHSGPIERACKGLAFPVGARLRDRMRHPPRSQMHTRSILQILVLLTLANGAPVVAKKIFGERFNSPLDGGVAFFDGRPLFGKSKTIRGIVVAVLATAAAAPLIGLSLATGAIVAAAAMAGDLLSSFTKRRLGFKPSSQALGLDQIPESLLPMLAARTMLPLSALDIGPGSRSSSSANSCCRGSCFRSTCATSRISARSSYPQRSRCSVISGGQLRRTGTTLDPAPTEV